MYFLGNSQLWIILQIKKLKESSIHNIEATEESLYRVASVSKPITGLMAMKLKQKGQLILDKDIRDYVPEYPQKPEGVISSKHLLSHQSGIIHYSGIWGVNIQLGDSVLWEL